MRSDIPAEIIVAGWLDPFITGGPGPVETVRSPSHFNFNFL